MCQFARVAQRLLGDDINRPGNGRRTEQCRTSATHHFYTVDHISRNLFQPVNTRKCTEYGTRVDQYLRIRAVQPIDTYLLETAILAIRFHTHTRLEVQSLRQIYRAGRIEDFRVDHIYQRRSQAARCFTSVSRNDHTVQGDAIFFHLYIDFLCFPFLQFHFPDDSLVTEIFKFEGELTFRQVLQEIMTGVVGCRSDGCSF